MMTIALTSLLGLAWAGLEELEAIRAAEVDDDLEAPLLAPMSYGDCEEGEETRDCPDGDWQCNYEAGHDGCINQNQFHG